MTATGAKAISGVNINLSVTLPDKTTALPIQGAQTTTDANGKFSMDYTPTLPGTYKLTASFDGNSLYSKSTRSASFSATAAPPAAKTGTSLSLSLAASSIQTGQSMHASGSLTASSGIPSAVINLQVILPDGSVAYPAQGSATTTDAAGAFSLDYVASAGGVYKFSATYGGSEVYASSSTSASFTALDSITPVKSASSVTLSLASSSIETGKSMHVDGLLKGTTPIVNAPVSLQVTPPDGSTAYPVQGAAVTTDSLGRFSMDYVPAKAGSYKFIATFAGSDQYNGSSASASFIASNPATTSSYKYVVTSVGGTYYAKNTTGSIIASGTNAASVINSALNSLTPGRLIKEKVLVQASASLTSRINMPNYAILECAPGVVFTESGVTQLIGCRSTHDWEIIGGEWVCTDKAVTSASTPMYFSSPLNCLIKDSKVRDSMWNNIILDNAKYVTIFNVESYHSWPLDPYNVEANGWHGIIFDGGGSNCVVDSCYLHDNGHGGCYFYSNEEGLPGQLNDNILRNNRVERVGCSGLSISQRSTAAEGNRNLIENNTLIDCGLDTQHPFINIGFYVGNPPAQHNIVRNNILIDNGIVGPTGTGADQGIIDQGQYTEIYGNDIRGCTGSITLLRAESSYVHDNYIHDAPSDTAIVGSANNSTVVNNSYHNMRNGISVSGTGNIIQNNLLVP